MSQLTDGQTSVWGEVANSGCGRGKYIGECGEGVGGGMEGNGCVEMLLVSDSVV